MLVTVALLLAHLAGQNAQIPATLPHPVLTALPAHSRAELESAYAAATGDGADAAAAGRLAMLLHAHDQLDLADAWYRRARALDPRAFAWPYLSGVVRADGGDHAAAEDALRDALRLDPTYLPARLRRADALMHAGRHGSSRDEYLAIVRDAPETVQAHYGLGRALSLTGDADGAIQAYRRATELAPTFGAAHYALALALRAAGRTSEAGTHFTAYRHWGARHPAPHDPLLDGVRALNGTAREILVQAARVGKAGNLDESIELHLKALAIDPTAAQAHVNLISLFGRRGQSDLAERHYRTALTLGTSVDEAHYNYGVLLAVTGRTRDAAAAFEQALQVNPFHAAAHSNLGALLAREGKLELAASHYEQAIANNPAHTPARVNLARLLTATGRLEEARQRFEQALQRAKSAGETDLAARIAHEIRQLEARRP